MRGDLMSDSAKTLLMNQFEVARIFAGHPMTITTIDGEEFRVYCPYRVEDEGIVRGLPDVPMGFDQFRTVATGGTAYAYPEFEPEDDYLTQIAVRLPTLEEWRRMKAQSKVWFEEHDLSYPEQPSEESQLWLITPLPASF
jgi:hypothetical protein